MGITPGSFLGITFGALVLACSAPASRAGQPPVDSITVVRTALLALDSARGAPYPFPLRVLYFVRDSAGIQLTLIPESPRPGGGGLVRLRSDGSIANVRLFQ